MGCHLSGSRRVHHLRASVITQGARVHDSLHDAGTAGANHHLESFMNMHPNHHERAEWLRCAIDATARGFRDTADRFSSASICTEMPIAEFDALQTEYRQWLIRGFAVQIAAQASL